MTATVPTTEPTPVRPNPPKRRRAAIAGVVVLLALGFLLWKGLGDATVFFYRADEAVVRKAELGDRRFRLEGIVVANSTRADNGGVNFEVEENGTTIDVVHQGDPPELFRDEIPVVLEGRWAGDHFASDRILVKHTSEYRKINPDRVKDYNPENPDR